MDKQGACTRSQVEEKGLRNVERRTGHLGGVKECCQSMEACNKEG